MCTRYIGTFASLAVADGYVYLPTFSAESVLALPVGGGPPPDMLGTPERPRALAVGP